MILYMLIDVYVFIKYNSLYLGTQLHHIFDVLMTYIDFVFFFNTLNENRLISDHTGREILAT